MRTTELDVLAAMQRRLTQAAHQRAEAAQVASASDEVSMAAHALDTGEAA